MEVSLIFKIAASWNSCIGVKPGVKAQRQGGTCVSYKSCRTSAGALLAGADNCESV